MNVDQKHVGTVDGFDIDVALVPDDGTPDDFDCYATEMMDAWRRDEWQFVGAIVTASRAGVALGSSSLWGMEYGNMPGADGFVNPLDDDIHGYGPDLLAEAITEARATIIKINSVHIQDQTMEGK